MFLGTETALKINGKPTIRFHMYTVVHNPAVSTTQALELEVEYGILPICIRTRALR